MSVPNDRKYRDSHEWFQLNGKVVTIGITQHAADALTDITYVDLPEVGTTISANHTFGEIESVKATSDLYTALSGKVVEINTQLNDHPEWVNSDPFGKGWMIKVEAANLGQLEGLMDAKKYDASIGH